MKYQTLLTKSGLSINDLPTDIVNSINILQEDIKKYRVRSSQRLNWRELMNTKICDDIQNWIKLNPNGNIAGITSEEHPAEGKSEQLHPDHYKAGNMDVIAFCHHHSIDFCRGNIIKYVTRAGKKKSDNPLKEIEDLKKAKVYLDREIAKLELQK